MTLRDQLGLPPEGLLFPPFPPSFPAPSHEQRFVTSCADSVQSHDREDDARDDWDNSTELDAKERLSAIFSMPALQRAACGRDIPSMAELDQAINRSVLPIEESDVASFQESTGLVSAVDDPVTDPHEHMRRILLSNADERACRRLNLPAMQDPSPEAEDLRRSSLEAWVHALSLWIDAVSEGRELVGRAERAAVDAWCRVIEQPSAIPVLLALLTHPQACVPEYAAEILGRVYCVPLMQTQRNGGGVEAGKLQSLMRHMHRSRALEACTAALSLPGALPCTILNLLNCVQSMVTFHPEVLSEAEVAEALVRGLVRLVDEGGAAASPEAYLIALRTPRGVETMRRLRLREGSAGGEEEGARARIWCWEVSESVGMTLAHVVCLPHLPLRRFWGRHRAAIESAVEVTAVDLLRVSRRSLLRHFLHGPGPVAADGSGDGGGGGGPAQAAAGVNVWGDGMESWSCILAALCRFPLLYAPPSSPHGQGEGEGEGEGGGGFQCAPRLQTRTPSRLHLR